MQISTYYFYTNTTGNCGSDSFLLKSFKILSDGSIVLQGDATQWNDQVTNKIEGINTINYVLTETLVTYTLPYAICDGKVWTKVSIRPNSSIVLNIIPDNSIMPAPHEVFEFYDDFETGSLEGWYFAGTKGWQITDKYVYQGKYAAMNQDIGDNQSAYMYRRIELDYPSIIRFYYKVSSESSYDYFRFYIDGNQKFARSGEINWRLVEFKLDSGTHEIKFGYTKDVSVSRGLDSAFVDLIYVFKDYDTNPLELKKTENPDGTYKIEIINHSNNSYNDIQLPLDLPTDKHYKITVTSKTPILTTIAMPPDRDSFVKFFTQFNHAAKYDSKTSFHIHTYIPPDATPGKVKLRLLWQVMPVEIITDGETVEKTNISNKVLNQIVKTFEITEDMKGRHVLLNFGFIDKVSSLSQVIFHRLDRLATDEEDTFNHPLPILYLDWHTEIDSWGSKDQFRKY